MNLPVQEPIMQPGKEAGSTNQAVWMQGSSPWMPMPSGHGIDNIVGELVMPKMDNLDADGTLHAIINDSVHSVDVPLQNPNFQDSEMFSWLHFPIDDAIDKGFCTDFLKDLPSSNAQIVKHSFSQLGLQLETPSLNVPEALLNDILPPNAGFSGLTVCPSISQAVAEVVDSCSSCPNEAKDMVAGADAAMVVDGGCVTVANTCHYGMESFNGFHASGRPPVPGDDCMQAMVTIPKLRNMDMAPLLNPNPSPTDRQIPSLLQEGTLHPVGKSVDVSFCSTQPVHRNFAHFSSPVAETRASLHAVSTSSGLTSVERARQPYGRAGKADCKQPCQRELVASQINTKHAALPSQSLPAAAFYVDAGETSRSKSTGDDHPVSSHLCNSAVTASNRAMEKLHLAEQTATSPSRGSASSSEKSGKEAAMALKRRLSGAEDSECQSEDLDDTTNNSKKSVKRSRAAQMHNLCERKRRDRINEKLLALRDLMPNSSKTAKASILDEAIEYVKLLQSQLQTWSARTGICIPPALIPTVGMQPVQMPAVPHMGLGMGVGMGVGLGMGMGLVDANAAAAAGRTMMPMPTYPAQPSTFSAHPMGSLQPCLPAMNMSNGQEQLQSPHLLDPFSMYVPHHQAQQIPMNLTMYRNMELYNAYMQGQQQQQHQWHQLQQQHQWQLLQQQLPQANTTNKPTQ